MSFVYEVPLKHIKSGDSVQPPAIDPAVFSEEAGLYTFRYRNCGPDEAPRSFDYGGIVQICATDCKCLATEGYSYR